MAVKSLTQSSKIAGVIKVLGSSSHGSFKLTRHSSYSCGGGRSVPLSLPLVINKDDVGTPGGDTSHGGGDVVLSTMDVVAIGDAVMEGTTVATRGICTFRLFILWATRLVISCSAFQAR